jgi:hypothetical protein
VFGYRLSPDQRHLEPDPTEQAALGEIEKLRRQGHSLRGIAATLNSRRHRTRRGTEWRLESVIVKQIARPQHAKNSLTGAPRCAIWAALAPRPLGSQTTPSVSAICSDVTGPSRHLTSDLAAIAEKWELRSGRNRELHWEEARSTKGAASPAPTRIR